MTSPEDDRRAELAAALVLKYLTTPVKGVPAVRVMDGQAANAKRIIKAALLAVHEGHGGSKGGAS